MKHSQPGPGGKEPPGRKKNPPPCFDSLAGVEQGEGPGKRSKRCLTATSEQHRKPEKVKDEREAGPGRGAEGISASGQAGSGPLEDYTKSTATFPPGRKAGRGNHGKIFVEFPNYETGEILQFERTKHGLIRLDEFNPNQYAADLRRERYRLQAVARSILAITYTPKGKRYRVCICLRRVHRAAMGVDVRRSEGRAYYAGLEVCGSVWTCPVCSDQVSRGREAEICRALDDHAADGRKAYMCVLTFPHKRTDALVPMMRALRKALMSLKSRRAYKEALEKHGVFGSVRALEVTWGDANGHHPHTHDLFFTDSVDELQPQQLRAWESIILQEWRKACVANGLGIPNRQHGVRITKAFSAAEYLTKFGRSRTWGPERELTRANSKGGCSDLKMPDRFTPFDFLRYVDKRPEFADLFREFSAAFFGSRQIYWSKGLKDHFNVQELTDAELAEKEGEDPVTIYTIATHLWYKLARIKDIRLDILEAAERGGSEEVEILIQRYLESN